MVRDYLRPCLFIGWVFLYSVCFAAKNPSGLPGNRFEHLSGISKEKADRSFWDRKYGQGLYIHGKAPATVSYTHLTLPTICSV